MDLQYEGFAANASEVTFTAKAVGREARDENNKLLPPKAMTVVFEALAKDGTVLGTQEVSLPALKVGESVPVSVKAAAAGARAWRYRIK